ncbi:MAG: Maf family protein [Phycisphaerales bacterium]
MPRSEHRLLLASRSPRRRELLHEHGLAHEVIPSGIDDGGLAPGRIDPMSWVMALAYLKARAGWELLDDRSGAVVLGADTVVIKGESVIGQPRDERDAARIVDALNNGSHRVATGVALIDEFGRRLITVDIAHVTVGNVSERSRVEYVKSGFWHGKAGAYNFAERVADGWPISCEGDEATVMGLPMKILPDILDRFATRGASPGLGA